MSGACSRLCGHKTLLLFYPRLPAAMRYSHAVLDARSVGTMAQPHIVDHTRLHLDFVAEIPIVAAYPVRVPMVSIGVQCQSTEERSEIHYDEDVVLVRCPVAVGVIVCCVCYYCIVAVPASRPVAQLFWYQLAALLLSSTSPLDCANRCPR